MPEEGLDLMELAADSWEPFALGAGTELGSSVGVVRVLSCGAALQSDAFVFPGRKTRWALFLLVGRLRPALLFYPSGFSPVFASS